jgi:hypothetical protein
VINKKFEDYFGSRVEFYKAVEFIFIHLNMSKMITFYKDKNLNSIWHIYTPGTFFKPLTPPVVAWLCVLLLICL